MNLLEKTKQICQKHNIKPARSKGQNFLISENVYDSIVEAAGLNKDDVVLEVGPGLGFLTERLAKSAKKVIAVELDDKLVRALEERMRERGIENVKVVNDNVLDFISRTMLLVSGSSRRFAPQDDTDYKIVANLPYNITSIFLRKILSAERKPKSLTLMLQKEVAERICAKSGKMSLLAVSVQFYVDARIVEHVSRNNFWPEPAVDSAIVSLKETEFLRFFEKNRRNSVSREKEFFRLVKFGFSAKRKMLKNNLATGYHITPEKAVKLIKKAGFSEKIRAQELSVNDWVKLLGFFS